MLHYFYRPIAGMINICPQHISGLQDRLSNILAIVQHEITHALVSTSATIQCSTVFPL